MKWFYGENIFYRGFILYKFSVSFLAQLRRKGVLILEHDYLSESPLGFR